MEQKTKEAVLAVLRESSRGFVRSTAQMSTDCGLSKWRRFVNWVVLKLGADKQPFTDPDNWGKIEVLPLSSVADEKLINEAMLELAPDPVCKVCGSKNLAEDPGGYYCDAVDYRGAPLACLNCANNENQNYR